MHFSCVCGRRITDITDNISYKASILADQDECDLFDKIESCVQDENLSRKECLDQILLGVVSHYMSRNMYQCPECGRIFIEDIAGKLHIFVPEGTLNKQLLTSVEGTNWKGFLHGEWLDDKPEWMEHHGYIEVDINGELSKENLVFDNKEEFEKQYYKVFEELKRNNKIRSALLKENRKWISSWNQKEE